jgi:hypothetical protein
MRGMSTHKAKRAEMVPDCPFAQATLNGFQTMLPPQENPAHLFAIGAVILSMASYGSVTVFGKAMPKVIPDSASEYDE